MKNIFLMIKFSLGCLLGVLFTTSLFGQVITDVPPNEPNSRFLNESPGITMRPGLSIAGFSNENATGLSLQQILNESLESESSSSYESVLSILSKAQESISLNPDIDQITNTTNILQYRAFEVLASLILEQNGVSSDDLTNTYNLDIRNHSESLNDLKEALNTLTSNNKLIQKNPGDEPFDDYLDALRSYNNMARAIDLYLAIENAYQFYDLDESALLSQQEKLDLMTRFRADINILFNDGLKRSYDLGGLTSVTEDDLEAGNRPLKGYLALSYASMSAQTSTQQEQNELDGYITTAIEKASATSDNQRELYWMYQTANGGRFWAEGPFYFDFALKDAITFWHAVRLNGNLGEIPDPFFNDWFLNPVQWLADLSTPDGFLPPLDDSNKRAIQSANLLRWSSDYGDEDAGRTFTTIFDNLEDYHSESLIEDQFFLIEAAIPKNENSGSQIESLINPEEQQFVIRHTDASNQNHYISFVGEKGKAITSGEGHEQPDQLQLLYYMDQFSFLTDGGYDNGSPQENSSWNGYKFTNTMQYNASEIDRTLDFVTYQNEGGLESPFASIVETRKISTHDEAEIFYENPAPNVELLRGQVDLNFESTTQSTSKYNRSVLIVKGENPYLIDVNDITANTGRNDFVMRYYGNSDQTDINNGWFVWEEAEEPFTSPTHQLFLYTVPLTGNYTEENETVHIQELQNRVDGEKQPYPVIRKSYISNEETDRFTTASILSIRSNSPTSEPEFITNSSGLSYFTHMIDSNTIDLFIFAADSSENRQSLTIQSGSLPELTFSLSANEIIGFSRLRMNGDSWQADSDFSVNLQSSSNPGAPQNLTVSIEGQSSGPAAILNWEEPEGDIAFYEVWKQVRNHSDQSEQPAEIIATSETNTHADGSISDLPPGEFEQRWFVKAVNSDSLVSGASNTTEWVYIDESITPDEFALFNPFPNPMKERGRVRYQLAEESSVTLQLYDLLGREIKSIVQETQPAGTYTANWSLKGIASGVYILRLTAKPNAGSTFKKSVMLSVIK